MAIGDVVRSQLIFFDVLKHKSKSAMFFKTLTKRKFLHANLTSENKTINATCDVTSLGQVKHSRRKVWKIWTVPSGTLVLQGSRYLRIHKLQNTKLTLNLDAYKSFQTAKTRPLFVYFLLFQTQFFQKNWRDSNSDHQSTLTT